MRPRFHRAVPACQAACAGVLLSLAATPLLAQSVDFETIVRAKECHVLVQVGDQLYGGLREGGVVIWDRTNPAVYRRWTARDGLSDENITDLAYTGSHLWVATLEGGLTRVTLSGSSPLFRQFSDLADRHTTAVAGLTRQAHEELFYGTQESGVGQINDGLPFAAYTSQEHGLIDDRITALAIFKGQLWVGTQAGISRFSSNLFSDQATGLPDPYVRTLHAAGDSLLLAGTNDGVARWDTVGGRWEPLPGLTGWIDALAVAPGRIWALQGGDGTDNRLWSWEPGTETWSPVSLPSPLGRTLAYAEGLYLGGEVRDEGMSVRNGHAALSRYLDPDWDTWLVDELVLLNIDGCSFGPDGSLWLGSRTGQGVDQRKPDGNWFHISQLASAANDSMGLFAFGSNILTLTVLPSGEVWFAQRTRGVVRYIPSGTGGQAVDDYDHITTENSGLSENAIRRIVQHPDGPLLFLSETQGVDVLLNPSAWRDPAQWLHLPTGSPDGLGGISLWDATIASRDVVWFAVDQVGLVRWDINGFGDQNATLTWQDQSDDFWSSPIVALTGSSYDPKGTRGLAVSADGTIWSGGGSGVAHFSYDADVERATLIESFTEKTSGTGEGLLTGTVGDIELDANDDLWVAMESGLNRIRRREGTTAIDAYTDFVNYFAFSFGSIYSPSIIAPLPGGQPIWELAAEPHGHRLLVGADAGAALLRIAPRAEGGNALDGLYLYPNPYLDPVADMRGLKLGGFAASVTVSELMEQGGAEVVIFNLEGQEIFRDGHVANDQAFWDGTNYRGELVSTGLYVVQVSLSGSTVVKTLAVVR